MGTEVLEELSKAITIYDRGETERCARELVQRKMDPLKALDVMTEAIRQVGDGFGRGELWLPDLVGAAAAMEAATPIIEEEIKRVGATRESLGSIVIGTVFGDIHTIGKTMVATLLTAGGFAVVDLGINVTAESFLDGITEHHADILAMSALMTTTAPEQRKVIETLEREGLRDKIKIMVGGGAITEEFAKSIGADGYDPTAPGAVALAMRLMGKKQ
ncbi:MAG: cobalamin-dependent protein [Deltaproteobacteria bacterium]|nr:cobalamin-dependent protein [Deltaproteobacteria bacterium]